MLRRVILGVALVASLVDLAGCERGAAALPTGLADVCDYKRKLPHAFCDCLIESAERDLAPEVQQLLFMALVSPGTVYRKTKSGEITGAEQAALDKFLEPAARQCKAMTATS